MKIHEECATAHEQNKYRATSGVGGSKKNLNRFHLGFAWTFYMIMAARLSNNSRARAKSPTSVYGNFIFDENVSMGVWRIS